MNQINITSHSYVALFSSSHTTDVALGEKEANK